MKREAKIEMIRAIEEGEERKMVENKEKWDGAATTWARDLLNCALFFEIRPLPPPVPFHVSPRFCVHHLS